MIFHLTDTKIGRPVTDLQTYLGAFGHTLIMSEDMLDYVHSHSLDILAADDETACPSSSFRQASISRSYVAARM